jgi:hypothetical protein
MSAPISASILAFGIAVNKIVLIVRAGNVPHLPLAIMKDEVGLINASALMTVSRNRVRRYYICGGLPLSKSGSIPMWSFTAQRMRCLLPR